MKKKVLIAGGSGLVGGRLSQLLLEQSYEVSHLSRSIAKDGKIKTIQWDVKNQQLEHSLLEPYDYIINLSGAGIIDKPWSEERKKEIIDSRVQSTKLLKKALSQNTKKPVAFVCASAIGYYGLTLSDQLYTEEDKPGEDFLAETCLHWEKSADEIHDLGIPTSKIRVGIVLSKDGGALTEMSKPIRLGFGAPLGTGKQYLPWIHIDDLCQLFIHCMENKLNGPYNAGAPNQHSNGQFTKVLAKVLGKPLWLPNVPSFVLRLILGARAEMVLKGIRVSPQRAIDHGFSFKFISLEETLKDIYS